MSQIKKTKEGISRRWKYYVISEHEILEVFNQDRARYLALPQTDIPLSSKILKVHYSNRHCAFLFLVYHISFDPIPIGAEVPIMNPEMHLYKLEKSNYKRKEK
jgi:hypothetical protein